jgi:hypothetical protein
VKSLKSVVGMWCLLFNYFRKLDEQAQTQRDRDERAEEKIRASRGETSDRREQVSATGRAIPGSARAPASAAPTSRYVFLFRLSLVSQ